MCLLLLIVAPRADDQSRGQIAVVRIVPVPLYVWCGDEVGKDFGAFDLICHIAFDQPPLTRRERVENVRKRNYFSQYGDQARAVLDALLEKYADEGVQSIEDMKVLRIHPLDQLGTPIEIVKYFGGRQQFEAALRGLENSLYNTAG